MKGASATYGFLLSCVIAIQPAQANPTAYPKRMVNGYTVDLQPLIDWWSSQKGNRPLPAWKHVRGTLVSDFPAGWVIEGIAEGHGQSFRFFVRNPPRERLRRFNELKTRLAQYERTSAANAEFLRRPVISDWYYVWQAEGPANAITETDYREVRADQHQLERNILAIREEMGPMQNSSGQFVLDALALQLQESVDGLAVYDHGITTPFK